MRPVGLTGPQADALVVIGQAGPLSLNELGDLLIAEAGHPSRLVDRLVEAGPVPRRPTRGDPPPGAVSPTPQSPRLQKSIITPPAGGLERPRQILRRHAPRPTRPLLPH